LGKPYAHELEKLIEIYDWAKTTPIDELSEFVKNSAKTPLYVIGSGGSFSATTFASLLHQHIGMIARCLTPLEFLEFETIDKNCSILIVTASGNNTDILSAFDKAVKLQPKNLGILCASTINKLTKKAAKVPNIFIHAVKLPTGKDGFLATNSLIATLIWLCRSYIESYSLPYEIPRLNQLAFQEKSQQKFEDSLNSKLTSLCDKETIVCLYDNWGKTAAIDAESKLVESGLVNVQLTDYRNFAHGRHNWLDKNKEKTAIIAFITPQCEQLAIKTLNLIPEYVPTMSLSTKYDGPIASIGLLIQVFYLVKFFGNLRKIDPGRPGVADFGRKIYHLSIPKNTSNSSSNFEKLALRKKFGNVNPNDKETKLRIQYMYKFIEKFSKEKFGAVIFDYDGTLCDHKNRFKQPSKEIGYLLSKLLENNIYVGIATGRGKSVRQELQEIIPKNLWSNLLIGYYNCGDIGSLNDNLKPETNKNTNHELKNFVNLLKEKQIISALYVSEERPKQISLQLSGIGAMDLIDIAKDIGINLETLKIVESSHSIDLLVPSVSKLNLFDEIKMKISSPLQILCVGDRGKFPGNDFELLDTEFSLSVDECNNNPNKCWNLLPLTIYGEHGVLEYFSHSVISHSFFLLDIKEMIK
jgi:fructoselysine-6-P-deglycase FrlB-like protein